MHRLPGAEIRLAEVCVDRSPSRSWQFGIVMGFAALNPSYCFSGTVIGLPLSATMTASTLAGSVWLALADTACSCPGAS